MSFDISEVALSLARHGCVLLGEFKLTSGLSSPYYIDLRAIPSHPDLFDIVADAYVCKLDELRKNVDGIAGIATAGIPIAALVAYKIKKPMLYVRREERGHGTQRTVEGKIDQGSTLVLLDDVATTGGSLVEAIGALRGMGAKVDRALVLVDREQGADKRLAEVEVELVSILTATELMRLLHSRGVISGDELERVIAYIRGGRHDQGT